MSQPPIVPQKYQIPAIASVLADAFADYPIYTYAILDPRNRVRALQALFGVETTYALKYGTIHATSDQLEGVMYCLPSTSMFLSNWRMVKSGALKLPLKIGMGFIKRQGIISSVHDAMRVKHASFPHTYLWNIGVKPELKGQGHAGRLVRHLLEELAIKNEPCYLETAREINVRLYEHLGFKLMEAREIPGTSITTWAMLWKK